MFWSGLSGGKESDFLCNGIRRIWLLEVDIRVKVVIRIMLKSVERIMSHLQKYCFPGIFWLHVLI